MPEITITIQGTVTIQVDAGELKDTLVKFFHLDVDGESVNVPVIQQSIIADSEPWTTERMTKAWDLHTQKMRDILIEIARHPQGLSRSELTSRLNIVPRDFGGILSSAKHAANRYRTWWGNLELPYIKDGNMYRMKPEIARMVLDVAASHND